MAKIKLLLVVTEFWQAGCQRYNYEIDKNINKDKFDVEILSFRGLNTNPEWPDYYYEKHKSLGTRIHLFPSFSSKKKFLKKTELDKKKFINFIDSYDLVIFQGEYCWRRFSNYLTYNPNKFFISIQNSIVQVANNYNGFDKNMKFNFLSPYTWEQGQIEFAEFKDYTFYNFPLSITAEWENLWRKEFAKNKKLGVFTRITPGKPIEPFIYAFQAILEVHPDAKLHIYGNGDPKAAGLTRHIEFLNLENNIVFEGHAEDMLKSVIEDQVSLVLFHGYHCVPGGFASFQLSSIGVPQVFLEMLPRDFFEIDQEMYYTNSVSKLAQKTIDLLNSPDVLENVSKAQLNKIKAERESKQTILGFEEYLTDFLNNNN